MARELTCSSCHSPCERTADMTKRSTVWTLAAVAVSISVLQSACGDRGSETPPAAQVANQPAAPSPQAPAAEAPQPALPPPEAARVTQAPPEKPAPPAAASRPAPKPSAPATSAAPAAPPAAATPAAAPAPAPPPPPPPPRTFTLRAGTPITVFTTSTLSTKANASGDAFNAVLAKAIVSDDWVIAKQGARVDGTIV